MVHRRVAFDRWGVRRRRVVAVGVEHRVARRIGGRLARSVEPRMAGRVDDRCRRVRERRMCTHRGRALAGSCRAGIGVSEFGTLDDRAATRSRCRVPLGPVGSAAVVDHAAFIGGKVRAMVGAGHCAADVRTTAECGPLVAENALVAGKSALRVTTGTNCCTTAGAGLTGRTGVAGRGGWLNTALTTHRCAIGVDNATVGVATGSERCATVGSGLATHPDIAARGGQVGATAAAECGTFITEEPGVTAGSGCQRRVSGSTGLGTHADIAGRAARRLSAGHTA